MATAVYLPKIGMTMEDAVLTRWLVAPRTPVSRGMPIFEIDVEKVLQDVEAESAGILHPLVAAGQRLRPGAVVGCITAPDELVPEQLAETALRQWREPAGEFGSPPDVASAPPAPQPGPSGSAPPPPPPQPPPPGQTPPAARVIASPSARRLARELSVDLSQVRGTGPGGRITEADVRLSQDPAEAAPDESRAEGLPEAPRGAPGTSPYAGRRRQTGERMAQSLRESAQLTLTATVRVDAAVEMASGLTREWRSDRTVVTFTQLVLRATAKALAEHPDLNARLDGERIVRSAQVNIGFAVDTPDGLIVPVLQQAGIRPLRELCRDFAALSRRAQQGELTAEDVTDGTCTVTSLEGFLVDAFTPILNRPQAAILGVGRVRKEPVIADGRIEVGQLSTLSLTVDHRLVDGAPAARMLGRVSALLERPYLLI